MKFVFRRLLGIFLIFIAFSGIFFSFLGIFFVWKAQDILIRQGMKDLDKLIIELDNAGQDLIIISQSVDTAVKTLQSLDVSLKEASDSLTSSTHFFDTAAQLSGEEFPETIRATQKAIQSASSSAKIIDDTLQLIASVPFIGSRYSPEVPLSTSLKDISTQLDSLPGTIAGIQDDVLEIKADFLSIQKRLSEALSQINQVNEGVIKVQTALTKYRQLLVDFKGRVQEIRSKAPLTIQLASLGISLFLFWFALSQIGLIVQGITLFSPLVPFSNDIIVTEEFASPQPAALLPPTENQDDFGENHT